ASEPPDRSCRPACPNRDAGSRCGCSCARRCVRRTRRRTARTPPPTSTPARAPPTSRGPDHGRRRQPRDGCAASRPRRSWLGRSSCLSSSSRWTVFLRLTRWPSPPVDLTRSPPGRTPPPGTQLLASAKIDVLRRKSLGDTLEPAAPTEPTHRDIASEAILDERGSDVDI